jgi:hypothetical protein
MFGPDVNIIMYSHVIKVLRKLCVTTEKNGFIHILNLRKFLDMNIQTDELYLVDFQTRVLVNGYWKK